MSIKSVTKSNKSKKRNDIIETATKLFNEHGYHSVGVDLIIKESNVAKMTFYKYFPSKEILISECLIERNKKLQTAISHAMDSCLEQTDALCRLKKLFFWYEAWFQSKDFYGCMFQKAIDEVVQIYPSTQEPTYAFKEWLLEVIHHELKVIHNNSNENNIEQMAILFVSTLEGLTSRYQTHANLIDMKVIWDYIEQLILTKQL